MTPIRTSFLGLSVLEPARHEDVRGWFARLWDRAALTPLGFDHVEQASISSNRKAGTLRGMHWQAPPAAEHKLVRCIRGEVYDVVADVDPTSPTYGRWEAFELTADNGRALAIGPGLAHGFLTLCDDAELLYLISAPYTPSAARGCRYDDPTLAVHWPREITVVSERDQHLPRLTS